MSIKSIYRSVETQQRLFDELEERLKYQFKEKRYLHEALTHRSFCINENKYYPHNERLEFLGDSILGFILAEELMTLFKSDNEGLLSKKRASLVNQAVLMEKALLLKLNQVLILGPGEKEQESHLKPRILASAYEALLGAFYLDAGVDFVKGWINAEFKNEIALIKPDLEFERDYKTRLQEVLQKLKLGKPEYRLILTQGPSHNPEFLVGLYLNENGELVEQFRAIGKSKKSAEQLAAQLMLQKIEIKNEIKGSEKLQ